MHRNRDGTDERRERSHGERGDTEADCQDRNEAGCGSEGDRGSRPIPRRTRNGQGHGGIANVVARERHAPLTRRRPGCAQRHGNVRSA